MEPARIRELAAQFFPAIQAIRRQIHAKPELAFEEHETAALVAGELQKLGFEVHTGIAKTGVVALLKGAKPGPVIALRADMDALPIQEKNEVDYRSQVEGKMHACGHDVHTACLLGAAMVLNELKEELAGTIKFIFQPSEEKVPSGASVMIKEGVLENPKPELIIGQHVSPELKVGTLGFRPGPFMASADEIYLTVKGKGGHAASPDELVDPIIISSHVLIAMQQLVSRRANPKMPTVLSFGDIHGYGATNIIPDEVKIKGTFRTFDEEWRTQALKEIKQLAEGMARSMGGDCEVEIPPGYPYVHNHESLTASLMVDAASYSDDTNCIEAPMRMGGEDFSFYSQQIPACFYRLGTGSPTEQEVRKLHTPTFNIDEQALEIGAGMMAWLAVRALAL